MKMSSYQYRDSHCKDKTVVIFIMKIHTRKDGFILRGSPYLLECRCAETFLGCLFRSSSVVGRYLVIFAWSHLTESFWLGWSILMPWICAWWCHDMDIWRCHDMNTWWCHDMDTWWCHDMDTWWCHDIWWCHDMDTWWCHDMDTWWCRDMNTLWCHDMDTWWCHDMDTW